MSPGGGIEGDGSGQQQDSVRGEYWRSAPVRRLRHPLEEAPFWGVFCSILGTLLAFLVGIPVLVLLLPALLLARLARSLASCRRHRQQHSADTCNSEHRPERIEPSAVLHAVLFLESNTSSSDSLDVASWRSIVATRLVHQYPRLRCRSHLLPLGRRCWLEDSCFDISQHVVDGSKDEASAWATPDQLQRYIAALVDAGLPSDRPPWELRLLPRTDDLVAIVRVHRGLADATTLVRFLSHALDDEAGPFQAKSRNGDIWGTITNLIRAALVGPFTVLLWLLLTVADRNLFTDRAHWEGSSTVFWSDAITLPKVTRIKQVTRSTTGCVLVSALAGGVRLALQTYGVRHPPDMTALMPVLVTAPQRTSLPGVNEPDWLWTPGIIRLPVSTEGAVPRLWSTRTNLKDLRRSPDPAVFYLATKALTSITPEDWRLPARLRKSLTARVSLQFVTAPGPRHRVRVLGYNVKGVYALVPADPCVGLAISAFSYHDHIYVTIISDEALKPAANLLLKHMHFQIEQLWQLLINRRVPGESPPLERRIDITSSPVKELRLRLSTVQVEVEEELKRRQVAASCSSEIIEISPSGERPSTGLTIVTTSISDEIIENAVSERRLEGLKSEFSALLNELYRRRGSLTENRLETDSESSLFRPRRRALSCSNSSTNSGQRSLLSKLTSATRPTSCIETGTSSITITKNSASACCFVAPNGLASPEERLKPFSPATVTIIEDNNLNKTKDDCSTEECSDVLEDTTESSYRKSIYEDLAYIQLPMEEEAEDQEQREVEEELKNLPISSKSEEKVTYWLTGCPQTICETISERNHVISNNSHSSNILTINNINKKPS